MPFLKSQEVLCPSCKKPMKYQGGQYRCLNTNYNNTGEPCPNYLLEKEPKEVKK